MARRWLRLLIATVACVATPASAEILRFKAGLSGSEAPTATGSTATGDAHVRIDTDRKLVSVKMAISGLTIDDLWDNLVKAPIGPIHFHQYGSHNHSGDDVILVLPVPFGPAYRANGTGFTVAMKDYDYAAGAKLLGSDATLDAFVAALKAGHIILNVHTDRFHDGEISGTVEVE